MSEYKNREEEPNSVVQPRIHTHLWHTTVLPTDAPPGSGTEQTHKSWPNVNASPRDPKTLQSAAGGSEPLPHPLCEHYRQRLLTMYRHRGQCWRWRCKSALLPSINTLIGGKLTKKYNDMDHDKICLEETKYPSFETCMEELVLSEDFFVAPTYVILISSGNY